MHRWNYDDEDDNTERFFESDEDDDEDDEDDEDGSQYISEEDYQALIGKASELQESQLELAELDINHRLLAEIITMCRSSWTWRFKSMKTRLHEIGIAYRYFQRLTDNKQK